MVGLPDKVRMRERDHLSQEDVAQLTHLGLGVIQRLESGKGRPVPAALDAVAAALRMYPDERRVFYELALGHPPQVATFSSDPDPVLLRYVRSFAGPALVVDAMSNVLSCNDLAHRWLLGGGSTGTANFARWLLLHPHARHVVVDWQVLATRVVSRLREVAARFPSDERVQTLINLIRDDELVDAIWTKEPGLFYVPMVMHVALRRPGHTDPAQPDDAAHQIPTDVVTLDSPRLDDERRVIAFVFEDQADAWLDPTGKNTCDACDR